MRRLERGRRLAIGAMVIAAVGAMAPARAATLTIHAPAGFTVKQSTPDGGTEVGYEVAATNDPDTGCSVNFTAATVSARRDQRRINAEAADRGHAARVAADLAALFDVKRVARFSMQGADGAVAIADPKAGEGAIRAAVYVLETPRGTLQVSCVAETDAFEAWIPVFERVARGVTLPR